MVRNKMRKFAFICTLTMISNIGFSAPQLIIFTDKSESTIGRPIRADLYGISLNEKISDIKLNQLSENFGIVTDYVINETSDERWPNKTVQILKLKLYPRKVGTVIIPRISSNNTHSTEKALTIIKGEMDLPELSLSRSNPYERQQIIAQFSLKSNNPTSRLSINEDMKIQGFDSQLLPFKRTKLKEGIYLIQIGIALSALRNGQLTLELPHLEYSVSGVSRKQFYFPKRKIDIKRLPLYLPPTIPVGIVKIQSKLPSTRLLKSDSIYYWNIELSGALNNTYQLPAILRQIKSNNHIKFLPADSRRSNITSTNNLTSIAHHSIPFKVLNSSFLKLPDIKLQYFDPVSGKIEDVFYISDYILVLSIFWRSVFGAFMILILVYITKLISKKWQRFKFSKYKREQALKLLKEENNIIRLRESIRLFSESEFWPKNLTISDWGKFWSGKYQTNNDFEEFIKKLTLCFYNTRNDHYSKKLNSEFISLIENRKTL